MLPTASSDTLLLAWIGAALFLGGGIAALAATKNLIRLIAASTLAEAGYVLLGFGLGEPAGATMHLMVQAALRGLVAVSAWWLIRGSGADDPTGSGRRQPVAGTLFGFGLFAAAGYSPFGGTLGRTLVLTAAAERGAWLLAAVAILGLVVTAAYTVIAVERICLAAPRREIAVAPAPVPAPPLAAALAVVAIGIGLTPGLGSETAWNDLVLLPGLGGFVLFALGRVSARGRDAAALLLAAAVLVLAWFAPDLDPASRLFALLAAALTFVVVLYSAGFVAHDESAGRYWLFLFLMEGSLLGLAAADNLDDFHLFWELMTWTSYLLVVHERTERALRAGRLYFLMCVAGAQAMHYGILLLHARAGGDFSAVAAHAGVLAPAAGTLILACFLAGFAVKSGLVPVHQWLPGAYAEAPSPVSALMSGIVTKAGLFGLLKVFYVVFGATAVTRLAASGIDLETVVVVLGCATLLFGEVMAFRETDAKRMLAYSSLAQIGEIGAAFGLGTSLAVTAGLLHASNHAAMKGLFFLAVGALILKSGKTRIADFAGLGRAMPITAGCAVLSALALMGLPPFSGFVSKFLLVYAAAQAGQMAVAAAILVGGLIGCFYYLRLARLLFFHPYEGPALTEAPAAMRAAMLILAAAVIAGGIAPQFQLDLIAPAVAGMVARGGMAAAEIPPVVLSWPPEAALATLGAVAVFLIGRKSDVWSGRLAVGVLLATAGVIVLRSAEYDRLSFWFALLVAVVGAGNMAYSTGYLAHGHAKPRFYASFGLMIAGLVGLASSRDAFGFFGFWELMSSWPLYFAIIHEETEDARREGFKYFIFNTVGASLIFPALALLGVKAGSLDLAAIGGAILAAPMAATAPALALILLGLIMKAAQLPVRIDYQMHPATAPTPISGYISAVLLKCALFAILKLGAVLGGAALFARMPTVGGTPLPMYVAATIGGVTILYSGAMAAVQTGLKRLLIYSTVSQLGYILLGISLGTGLGVAGGLMHLANHMMLKNTLFLGAGCILAQFHAASLDTLGGLGRKMPVTFGLFLFAGLSLAGLPPLNGFSSKWVIFQACFESGHSLLGISAMVGSLLTLAAILKFVHAAFLGTPSAASLEAREAPPVMLLPMATMVAVSVIVGVFPGILLVPISAIEAELGLAPVAASLFGGLPGPDGWNPAAVSLSFLALVAAAGLYLRPGRDGARAVVETHLHTCGVTDLPVAQVGASNLFETADKAIRLALLAKRGS
jgi:formate hydrogenlyase subunit 3/multisubunit Na+/H+ antiporter MnhD subunit